MQNQWLFFYRQKNHPRERGAHSIMLLGLLAVELLLAIPAAAENFTANSAGKSLAKIEVEKIEETTGAVKVPLKPRLKEKPADIKLIAGLMFGTSVIERSPNEEAPNEEAPNQQPQNQQQQNQQQRSHNQQQQNQQQRSQQPQNQQQQNQQQRSQNQQQQNQQQRSQNQQQRSPAGELSAPPSKTAPENVKKATYLLLSLSDRHLYLYKDNRLQSAYPVAIGRAGWETPTGSFRVIEKIHEPVWENPVTGAFVPAGSHNPLGSRWIGFWTDGTNYIGFHGTPNEEAIGQAVSHGCVRMRDRDIVALFDLIDVGTTVKVEP